MKGILKIFLIAGATILVVYSQNALSEEASRGPHYGYYAVDRWGQKVFHVGPYHMFVSDEAARDLEKYKGRPVEIKATDVSQPINPGGDLIMGIEKVSEKGVYIGLKLSLEAESAKIARGEGLKLRLKISNRSEEAITVHPALLAMVLVTNSPFSGKDIGYKDPEDCAYWYHQETYRTLDSKKALLRVACREVNLSWTAEELIEKGEKIQRSDEEGKGDYIVIESGGKLKDEQVVGKELLPDDYEVFFYLSRGNFSHTAGPMSERVQFDVLKKEEGD